MLLGFKAAQEASKKKKIDEDQVTKERSVQLDGSQRLPPPPSTSPGEPAELSKRNKRQSLDRDKLQAELRKLGEEQERQALMIHDEQSASSKIRPK